MECEVVLTSRLSPCRFAGEFSVGFDEFLLSALLMSPRGKTKISDFEFYPRAVTAVLL